MHVSYVCTLHMVDFITIETLSKKQLAQKDRYKKYAQTKTRNKMEKQGLTVIKLTNNGDIDGRVQLPSSPPLSLVFDPVDVKAGFTTKEPVWSRRKPPAVEERRKQTSSFLRF